MIRPIAPLDVEGVIRLIAELHRRSPHYRRVKIDLATAMQHIVALTANGYVRVAEHDGKVTGIIACLCEEFWWTEQRTGARYATDLMFYSKRKGDGVQMLKGAIEWAWTKPRVVCFETAVSSGIEHKTVAAMYESAGLQLQGSFWRINHPNLEN